MSPLILSTASKQRKPKSHSVDILLSHKSNSEKLLNDTDDIDDIDDEDEDEDDDEESEHIQKRSASQVYYFYLS